MDSRQKRIAGDLLSIRAVFFRPDEPFIWASGIKSPVYCDNRLTLTAPEVRNDVENALADVVREQYPDLGLTVSATTREPREGEVDGLNYYFLSDDEFARRVDAGEFVEWAEVHGHRYGTLVSEVSSKLASGQSLVLEIDVQGAFQVKERFPEAVLLFIMPPSLSVLKERLIARGSETEDSLSLRLANAEREMALSDRYDDIVVNDDLERSTAELLDVIKKHERN